jgi:hypothetical protein
MASPNSDMAGSCLAEALRSTADEAAGLAVWTYAEPYEVDDDEAEVIED